MKSDQVTREAWLSLALLSAANFIIIQDLMAANVAFPFIEQEFIDTPRSTLAWALSGHAIAAAALLLVAGRLGDRLGRRRIFLTGLSIFTAVSVVTATAPTAGVLIAGRVGQGAGAAMVTSTAIALLLPLFPASKQGLAVGIWGTTASAGAAAGPTLGALAIDAIDWRWAFVSNVPIGLLVLALGRRVLAEIEPSEDSRPIDFASAIMGTVAIGTLTFGVLQGPRWGWSSTGVVSAFVLAVAAFAAFILRCLNVASPLVDLELFGIRTFSLANLSQAGTQLAINAWFFTTPLFLINVWGYSALAGGSAIAIGMIVSFVSIPVGHWSDRNGYRGVLGLGGLLAGAGMLVWVFGVGETPNFWSAYVIGLVVFGLGAGMVGIVVTNAALTDLPAQDLGIGNAVFQTVRRLSGAIGVALAVALLGGRINESVDSFRNVWLLIAGGYFFSALVILPYPRRR